MGSVPAYYRQRVFIEQVYDMPVLEKEREMNEKMIYEGWQLLQTMKEMYIQIVGELTSTENKEALKILESALAIEAEIRKVAGPIWERKKTELERKIKEGILPSLQDWCEHNNYPECSKT